MKVTMVGTGYLGLVAGACLAGMGRDVVCTAAEARSIRVRKAGSIPVRDPALQEIVLRKVSAGRAHFTAVIKRPDGKRRRGAPKQPAADEA